MKIVLAGMWICVGTLYTCVVALVYAGTVAAVLAAVALLVIAYSLTDHTWRTTVRLRDAGLEWFERRDR